MSLILDLIAAYNYDASLGCLESRTLSIQIFQNILKDLEQSYFVILWQTMLRREWNCAFPFYGSWVIMKFTLAVLMLETARRRHFGTISRLSEALHHTRQIYYYTSKTTSRSRRFATLSSSNVTSSIKRSFCSYEDCFSFQSVWTLPTRTVIFLWEII